jgi:hypothetical protein
MRNIALAGLIFLLIGIGIGSVAFGGETDSGGETQPVSSGELQGALEPDEEAGTLSGSLAPTEGSALPFTLACEVPFEEEAALATCQIVAVDSSSDDE